MERRITLGVDLSLSRIAYGMMRLGDDADTSASHVQAKIEACLAQGITTMDQADIYGGYSSEAILGAALAAAPALRDQIEIVTKCGIIAQVGRHAAARIKHYDTSRHHILASVEHSLRLMGVERIDLMLIHRPDPLMDHNETGAALDEIVASGKVRAVGVSNFRPWDWSLLQSAMQTPLATNQIALSLDASQAFSNGDVTYLQQLAKPIMAWSPLGSGSVLGTGKSGGGKSGGGGNPALSTLLRTIAAENDVDAAAVAVAWLLAHPARILPVLGTGNLDRIRAISDAFKVKIDRQTWFGLYEAALGQEVV